MTHEINETKIKRLVDISLYGFMASAALNILTRSIQNQVFVMLKTIFMLVICLLGIYSSLIHIIKIKTSVKSVATFALCMFYFVFLIALIAAAYVIYII